VITVDDRRIVVEFNPAAEVVFGYARDDAVGRELLLGRHVFESTAISLTAREVEVLQLAARGIPGPQIAAELFVSLETVKTHFSNIYAKLGISDRAGAVAQALRLGLIE
jgi:ATP/maltotriose-dependent transcriptional regulator MalT